MELTLEKYESLAEDNVFWEKKINEIIKLEGLEAQKITRFKYGSSIVYSYNSEYVIKLYPIFYRDEYLREVEVFETLEGKINTVEIPKMIKSNQFEGWDYIIMTELHGKLLIDIWHELSIEEKQILSKDLGKVIKEFHSISIESFKYIDINWENFMRTQISNMKEYHKKLKLNQQLYAELDDYVDEKYIDYQPQKRLLTGEYTPFNLFMENLNGKWRLTGLIDFADCFLGDPIYDLLGPILFMFTGDKDLIRGFLTNYGYKEDDINEFLQKKLMIYTILHRFSNINNYIAKNKLAKQTNNFAELAELFFSF